MKQWSKSGSLDESGGEMSFPYKFIQFLPVTALTGLLEQKKWRCLVAPSNSEKKAKIYFYIPGIQNFF